MTQSFWNMCLLERKRACAQEWIAYAEEGSLSVYAVYFVSTQIMETEMPRGHLLLCEQLIREQLLEMLGQELLF